MKAMLIEEVNFRGMTLKVWMAKPLAAVTDYYVTVDGERVSSENTAERAVSSAKRSLG